MLQISTGKFFQTPKLHETLYRGTYYTNYLFFNDARIETPVGALLPSTFGSKPATLTYETTERLEAHPSSPVPGELISTGGDAVVNDFAAIISFALNVTCTPSPDLARRLIAPSGPTLGSASVPQKFIPRVFDSRVIFATGDDQNLSAFITDLIALDRKHYEGAMRAIRRYVTGTHRIADDVDLAYSLFVMAIELLAQEFDGHVPVWSDYEQTKRGRIDAALSGATDNVAGMVREAILKNEHVALSRRFREFTLAHVAPSFFRAEAGEVEGPVSRPDLGIALRRAYEMRSGYVHRLQGINTALIGLPGFTETLELDGQTTLTFSGLSRLARHVITRLIAQGPKAARETFNYRNALPNMITLPLAPQYWIGNPELFTVDDTRRFVSAFLGQISGLLLGNDAPCTDLRPVLEKVELLLPQVTKTDERLPLLTLYFLFHQIASPEFHRPRWLEFFEGHRADFNSPSIESMVVHLIAKQSPDWTVEQLETLHGDYFGKRHSATATKLGRFFEAAFTLDLAERYRHSCPSRARELVAVAVECMPEHAGLKEFESSFGDEPNVPIDWHAILAKSALAATSKAPP